MLQRLAAVLAVSFLAAANFGAAPTPKTQPPIPCATASAECTEWVVLAGGPARSLIYRTYALNARNEAISRVLVMVHGAGRDADNYFRSTLAAAFLGGALDNTLLIAPRMASNDGAGCRDDLAKDEISWNCSSWRSGGPSLSAPAVTSFDFIDEILRRVARKDVFPNLKAIVVAGHSAGGQVVNRYEMATQMHDKVGVPVTYIVSNPSSYAWPTGDRPTAAAYALTSLAPGYVPEAAPDAPAYRPFGGAASCTTFDQWPFGLQNRSGYSANQSADQLRSQLATRPTRYLLGQLDILPLAGFDSSCPAMAQGPTRLARGQAFGRYVNEKLGGRHVITVVPLCGHNARCMFTSEVALPLLFPRE